MAPTTKNTTDGLSGGCHTSLSSFVHPCTLNLVDYNGTANRICDVCGDHANGLVYQCKGCEFDVHPICTSFPRELNHAHHPNHKLVYQTYDARPCAVCGGVCRRWRYRCADCGFDIHPECVLIKSRDSPTSRAKGPQHPPQVQRPPPYAAKGIPYGYGNPYYPFNSFATNNNMPNQFANFHPAPFYMQHNHGSGFGYPYYPNFNNFAPNVQNQFANFHPAPLHMQPPHNYGNFPAQGGVAAGGSWPGRTIYEIVRSLALGVLSNEIFGLVFN